MLVVSVSDQNQPILHSTMIFNFMTWFCGDVYALLYAITLINWLCRKVIHTMGPKYAVKYHIAAENALSHCYRSCLELLIESGIERFIESFNA